mmetsp:Transcript_1754/g.3177  ORF Transcript_1754/g.3177 Transcript_1754/m.3177 type:complete len:646 (-) Transcript_1754:58-1995(-)
MNDTIGNVELFPIYSDKAVELFERLKDKSDNNMTKSTSLGRTVVLNEAVSGIRGRTHFSSDNSSGESSDDSDDTESSNNSQEARLLVTSTSQQLQQLSSNVSSVSKPSSSRNKKLKSKKKSKDELIQQMGVPPRVSIVVDGRKETNFARVVELPSALLPPPDQEEEDRNFRDNDSSNTIPFHKLYKLSENLNKPISDSNDSNLILILILQSGRFAAGIFHKGKCIRHTTSTRYTTRKGQGGAQSSHDKNKGKAKSVGSQLRRAGEAQLRQDVAMVLRDWKHLLNACALYFISLSKTLQKGFWDDAHEILRSDSSHGRRCDFYKKSPFVLGIPLDVGRPSYEGCCAVYDIMTTCVLQQIDLEAMQKVEETVKQVSISEEMKDNKMEDKGLVDSKHQAPLTNQPEKKRVIKDLTPLHEAAKSCNVKELNDLLSEDIHKDYIDERAGEDDMTPLHFAAASLNDPSIASECVYTLLVKGHANPCILDARNRVPYYLASVETIRNSFRKARAVMGEDIWKWTEGAKVGPPLSDTDLQRKKEKAAEKKRMQRQRQKERKAMDLAEREAEKMAEMDKEMKMKQEEEAKRVRAGLASKVATKPGEYACDFCQKICKRKASMFAKLDFYYCSMECVRKHQRELTAAAASARMNK